MTINHFTSNNNPGSPNPAAPNSRLTPVDPVRVLRRYSRFLSISVGLCIVASVLTWAGLRFFFPIYTSEVQFRVTSGIADPYQATSESNLSRNQTQMELMQAFIQNQIIRLSSHDIIDDVIKRPQVRETAWFQSFRKKAQNDTGSKDIREDFKENLAIVPLKGSTYISVSFSDHSDRDPQVILQQLQDVYLRKIASETDRQADDVRETFVRESNNAEQQLTQIQKQLKDYALQHDLPNLESRNHEATIAYQTVAEQIATFEVQLESAREIYQGLMALQNSGQIV
jgi:uncharacterized protein involved in exopolysaccharide biosynthesis